jgi:HTH-type transcriptional regulator / antitoxin HigA
MASASYAELLRDTQPEIIRDARSHSRALKVIAALMDKPKLTAAEGKLLDLLSRLVDDYEETVYPTPHVSPADMLEHFMDARGASQAEVARGAGVPRSTVSEVLKGKRAVSVENAFRLGEFFHVDPTLFLARP